MRRNTLAASTMVYTLALFVMGSAAGTALGQFPPLSASGTVSVQMTGIPSQADSQTDFGIDEPAIAITRLVSVPRPSSITIGNAIAKARGNYGDLGVSFLASVSGGNDPAEDGGKATASAMASYQDRIVVSAPSLRRGEFIDLVADITFDGSIDVLATPQPPILGVTPGGDARASGSVSLSVFNTPGLASLESDGIVGQTATLASHQIFKGATTNFDVETRATSVRAVISAPNDIGTTFRFEISGGALAESSGTGMAFVSGNFFGSAHWGGITAVRNRTTGEVIENWTITSDSGFDYTKSFENQVPEPSSSALLTFWLCVSLGHVTSRQRRT